MMENKYKDGFERRKEHSKKNIRRAALELFSQFGVDRVSIVDIAKKAGVSQATIYNNFGSKEALAREFVTTMVAQLVGNAEKALSPAMPFDEKITAFIGFISAAMTHGYAPDAAHASLPGSIALQADPEIQEILDTAKKKMIDLLLDVVYEGKDQGFIQSDVSDETYMIYLTAFMDIFIDPKIRVRFLANPGLVEDLTTLIINGLR
jgi:AcrR family transcriptional regulator